MPSRDLLQRSNSRGTTRSQIFGHPQLPQKYPLSLVLLVLTPAPLPPLQTKTNHQLPIRKTRSIYSILVFLVNWWMFHPATPRIGVEISGSTFLICCFDLRQRRSRRQELETGQEGGRPAAAFSHLVGLPPPVLMGERLDFGCAVGFGEAAVERWNDLEPKCGIGGRQHE